MSSGPVRERRLLAAALRFLESNEEVRDARAIFGRGTPECRGAVTRRREARRSLLYHAEALRKEATR